MRSPLVLAFVSVLLVSCGAAEPRSEPASRAPRRQPTAEAEAPPPEPELHATAPSTVCIESAEPIVHCDGAAVPARTHDELMAALTARVEARRLQPRGRPDDAFTVRALDDEELALVSELHADRCAHATLDLERARSTYWLARIHYEANHVGPAALLFDEVALDPQSGELAIYAAQLALDSLNVALRGTEGAAHDDCLARFASAVGRYHTHFCGASIAHEELCRTLDTLTAQLAERAR